MVLTQLVRVKRYHLST